MKVTKAKNGKYNATFDDSKNDIIRIDKRVGILELVEISKETIRNENIRNTNR